MAGLGVLEGATGLTVVTKVPDWAGPPVTIPGARIGVATALRGVAKFATAAGPL